MGFRKQTIEWALALLLALVVLLADLFYVIYLVNSQQPPF
jgi:hypothetical protein